MELSTVIHCDDDLLFQNWFNSATAEELAGPLSADDMAFLAGHPHPLEALHQLLIPDEPHTPHLLNRLGWTLTELGLHVLSVRCSITLSLAWSAYVDASLRKDVSQDVASFDEAHGGDIGCRAFGFPLPSRPVKLTSFHNRKPQEGAQPALNVPPQSQSFHNDTHATERSSESVYAEQLFPNPLFDSGEDLASQANSRAVSRRNLKTTAMQVPIGAERQLSVCQVCRCPCVACSQVSKLPLTSNNSIDISAVAPLPNATQITISFPTTLDPTNPTADAVGSCLAPNLAVLNSSSILSIVPPHAPATSITPSPSISPSIPPSNLTSNSIPPSSSPSSSSSCVTGTSTHSHTVNSSTSLREIENPGDTLDTLDPSLLSPEDRALLGADTGTTPVSASPQSQLSPTDIIATTAKTATSEANTITSCLPVLEPTSTLPSPHIATPPSSPDAVASLTARATASIWAAIDVLKKDLEVFFPLVTSRSPPPLGRRMITATSPPPPPFTSPPPLLMLPKTAEDAPSSPGDESDGYNAAPSNTNSSTATTDPSVQPLSGAPASPGTICSAVGQCTTSLPGGGHDEDDHTGDGGGGADSSTTGTGDGGEEATDGGHQGFNRNTAPCRTPAQTPICSAASSWKSASGISAKKLYGTPTASSRPPSLRNVFASQAARGAALAAVGECAADPIALSLPTAFNSAAAGLVSAAAPTLASSVACDLEDAFLLGPMESSCLSYEDQALMDADLEDLAAFNMIHWSPADLAAVTLKRRSLQNSCVVSPLSSPWCSITSHVLAPALSPLSRPPSAVPLVEPPLSPGASPRLPVPPARLAALSASHRQVTAASGMRGTSVRMTRIPERGTASSPSQSTSMRPSPLCPHAGGEAPCAAPLSPQSSPRARDAGTAISSPPTSSSRTSHAGTEMPPPSVSSHEAQDGGVKAVGEVEVTGPQESAASATSSQHTVKLLVVPRMSSIPPQRSQCSSHSGTGSATNGPSRHSSPRSSHSGTAPPTATGSKPCPTQRLSQSGIALPMDGPSQRSTQRSSHPGTALSAVVGLPPHPKPRSSYPGTALPTTDGPLQRLSLAVGSASGSSRSGAAPRWR